MKYEVIQDVGNFKVGDIVDDSDLYVRRKIEEGGCMKPIQEKQIKSTENKMLTGKENKGAE
jgi:3-dehydroquinate synthase class II